MGLRVPWAALRLPTAIVVQPFRLGRKCHGPGSIRTCGAEHPLSVSFRTEARFDSNVKKTDGVASGRRDHLILAPALTTFRTALPVLILLVLVGCGNSPGKSASSLLADLLGDDAFDTSVNGACGPLEIALAIPDCPLDLVCFTSACEVHNVCYGTCDASKEGCDLAFYHDMLAICHRRTFWGESDAELCRSLAFAYWMAVATLGQEAFDATQVSACGLLDDPIHTPGACCTPDGQCDHHGVQDECVAAGGRFLPMVPCGDLDCSVIPANDDCARAMRICEDQPDPADLGWCESDPDVQCSISQPDCPDDATCQPDPQTDYVCTIETDNRLATTDGPEAGGSCVASGVDSFQADVWYDYVAPCSGRLSVRMCDGGHYDAMLAVYGSHSPDADCTCPLDNSKLLECDDDFCGGGSVSAVVIDGVVEGACYTIRVGGWSWDGTRNGARQGLSEIEVRVRCEDAAAPVVEDDLQQTPPPAAKD